MAGTAWDRRDGPAAASRGGGPVRLRLDIAYDGTDFRGWARQPGLRTVCGAVEDVMSTVLREPAQLAVAGRTDAGVHAAGQVAHLDVSADALRAVGAWEHPGRLVRRFARMLPQDVRITAVSVAHPDFHARFSAVRRHYLYRVSTAAWGADPVRARDTATWRGPVDLAAMRRASASLVGLRDFAAFCRKREGATTVRELQRFSWERDPGDGNVLIARVSADAFCWSMVRSLVGAALTVGTGRRDPEWMTGLLGERVRSSAVPVAAAKGLCLAGVDYPPDAELAERNRRTMDRRAAVDGTGGGCCAE